MKGFKPGLAPDFSLPPSPPARLTVRSFPSNSVNTASRTPGAHVRKASPTERTGTTHATPSVPEPSHRVFRRTHAEVHTATVASCMDPLAHGLEAHHGTAQPPPAPSGGGALAIRPASCGRERACNQTSHLRQGLLPQRHGTLPPGASPETTA